MADVGPIAEQISTALEALAVQMSAMIGNDQSFMEIWGWNLPAINRNEFAEYIRHPIKIIDSIKDREFSDSDIQSLMQFPSRIAYFQAQALPNLPGGSAAAVYLTARSLIDSLVDLLEKYAKKEIDWESPDSDGLLPASQLRRLRVIQKNVDRLLSGSENLRGKIAEIDAVHTAAKELPTSLAELTDARTEYKSAIDGLIGSEVQIETARKNSEKELSRIEALRLEADAQMKNIDAAYSAATTQGLGKAFGDKARRLSNSTWGLFLALGCDLLLGAYITSNRVDWIHNFMEKSNPSIALVWVNVWLTIASVAGPIWFGWLLTKQIGQRFRLAEDYDFKASVAKAYEGYRREAVNIDPELGRRLFALALDRLSEEPLRHIEKQSHGSPLHEVLGNLVRGKAVSNDRESASVE